MRIPAPIRILIDELENPYGLRKMAISRLVSASGLASNWWMAPLKLLRAPHVAEGWHLSSVETRNLIAAIDHLPQGICLFDAETRIILCNRTYHEMYSLSPDIVRPGCTLRELIQHRKNVGGLNADVDEYVKNILSELKSGKLNTRIIVTPAGRIINIVNNPIARGGWIVTHEDITEQKRTEDKAEFLVRHDALTGLFNRTKLVQCIAEKLNFSRRTTDEFALLIVNLRRFNDVNDTLGHSAGDAVLREVAIRLKKETRASDAVARLGSDEFAIVYSIDGNSICAVSSQCERIQRNLGEPYEFEGRRIELNANIGASIALRDGGEASVLLKNAATALQFAKSDGSCLYRIFDPAMNQESRARSALLVDLRRALGRNEFELHYQTIVDFKNTTVTSAEALIRWRHPERGLIRPDEFIPLAEQSGLIVSIGEWAIRSACAQAVQWPGKPKVAVNLSSLQFDRGDLPSIVSAALVDSGLPAGRLELEITETVSLKKTDRNLEQLLALKTLGVSIALDDFGTGFSSLSYLRSFPFDTIKIDRSFVADMLARADCAAIVNSLITLSNSLGAQTVAEGIETSEQFDALRLAGCSFAQGFLISKPRPPHEMVFSPPCAISWNRSPTATPVSAHPSGR